MLYFFVYYLTFVFFSVSFALLQSLWGEQLSLQVLRAALLLATMVGITYLFRRFLDQRSMSGLGLSGPVSRALKLTARGFLAGTAIFSIAALIQLASGSLMLTEPIRETASIGTTLAWGVMVFAWLALSAMSEEVVSRGYLLQNLAAGSNAPTGILISAALFGFLHLTNPNAGPLAILNISLAGLFFGLYYLAEGTLWGPFGAHLAWNFAQGYLWGLPVSGIMTFERNPLLDFEASGSNWLTGGAFGPEGGAAVSLALIAATIVLLITLARKSHGKRDIHSKRFDPES